MVTIDKVNKYIGWTIIILSTFALIIGRDFELIFGRNLLYYIILVTFGLVAMSAFERKQIQETE